MSNPANCNEFFEQLSAYHDDELDAAEKAAVEQHLPDCSSCSKQLENLRLVANAIRGMARPESKRELDFSFLESAPAPLAGAVGSEPGSTLRPLPIACCDGTPAVLTGGSPASTVCQPFAELLNAYHDNELSVDEKESLGQHLADCEPCNRRLAEIRRVVEAIKAMPKLAPATDFAEKLDRESKANSNVVSLGAPASSRHLPGKTNKKTIAIFAAAAAAAALLLVGNLSHNNSNVAVKESNPSPENAIATKPAANPGQDSAPELPLTADKLDNSEKQNLANKQGQPESQSPDEGNQDKQPLIATDSKPANKVETQQANKPVQIAQQIAPAQAAADLSDQNEIALMPDAANSSADALGIGTDEDGLYDIKI